MAPNAGLYELRRIRASARNHRVASGPLTQNLRLHIMSAGKGERDSAQARERYMRKFAMAFAAATLIAAPALAQDFRANRLACAKEVGASPTYRHGHYGWRIHHMAQSQRYLNCLSRRGGVARVSSR